MARSPVLIPLQEAIADQLRAALDSEIDGIQVEPRYIINPTPPCLDILPAPVSQEAIAFGIANNDVNVQIRARVNTADDDAAQDLLLALMDYNADTSVERALMVDPTFGGRAESSAVTEHSGMVEFPAPAGQGLFLGCTWTVKVYAVEPASVVGSGYGASAYGSEGYGD